MKMLKYPLWSDREHEAWEKIFNIYPDPNEWGGISIRNLYNKGYALFGLDDQGIGDFFWIRQELVAVGLDVESTVQGQQLKLIMKWEGME
jgi:hypothetical protein